MRLIKVRLIDEEAKALYASAAAVQRMVEDIRKEDEAMAAAIEQVCKASL